LSGSMPSSPIRPPRSGEVFRLRGHFYRGLKGTLSKWRNSTALAYWLVGHCIQNIIHAQPDSQGGESFGVAGIVRELPRIADVGVVGRGDHDSPLVVINSAPVWDAAGWIFIAGTHMSLAGNNVPIVQIKRRVKDRVFVRDVDDLAFRKRIAHAFFKL